MNLRVIVIILLWLSSSRAAFRKCCPESEIVQVESFEDNNLSPRRHFSCVSELLARVNVKRRRESELYAFNNTSVANNLIAYNVLIGETSHWPTCGDNSLLSFAVLSDSTKVSPSASCVDIMNNNYHIFTCDETLEAANDFVDIYKIRKCCDKDFSYDVFTRQCVVNNQTTLDEGFQEFLRDTIVAFETGIPECKPDDVLVEYHSNVHKLKIQESDLIISSSSSLRPDVILQNSYCVESTLNSIVDIPDGADHNHYQLKNSSNWIAKVCRPADICKQMPCVRKCCKEGQRMVFDNETFCESHHTHLDLKFHSFDIRASPERPSALEPTGEFPCTQDSAETRHLENPFQAIFSADFCK